MVITFNQLSARRDSNPRPCAPDAPGLTGNQVRSVYQATAERLKITNPMLRKLRWAGREPANAVYTEHAWPSLKNAQRPQLNIHYQTCLVLFSFALEIAPWLGPGHLGTQQARGCSEIFHGTPRQAGKQARKMMVRNCAQFCAHHQTLLTATEC
jgi:hypothetical protein